MQMKQIFKKLASLKITVSCFLLLVVLTVVGTLYQVQYGLYGAQQRVFYSWVFMIGGLLPFPGVRLVLWVLFMNLCSASVIRFGAWRKSIGLLLVHFGLLLLFIAAFGKFHWGHETHLSLMEGDTSNMTASYHEWEVAFWKPEGDKREVMAVDVLDLVDRGDVVTPLGMTMKLVLHYPNSLAYRKGVLMGNEPYENISGIVQLKPQAINKEREQNIPGILLDLKVSSTETQRYLLYGGEEKLHEVSIKGEIYVIALRQKRSVLPLTMTLLDVKRELYPGTEIPSHYESRLQLDDGRVQREILVSMNQPFRWEYYTFFQASYSIDEEGKELSTLAVAYNPSYYFPYVACLLVVLGLLGHFLQMFVCYLPKRILFGLIGLCVTLFGEDLVAQDFKDAMVDWGRLVVMDEGRAKPLESFAKNKLIQFSGRQSFQKRTASEWLARVMITPEEANRDLIFQIDDPALAQALGIKARQRRRYHYDELNEQRRKLIGMAQDVSAIAKDQRRSLEKEVLRIAFNLIQYEQLQQCLAYARPSSWFHISSRQVRSLLDLPDQEDDLYSFYDLFVRIALLQKEIKEFLNVSQEEWNVQQQEIFSLAQNVFLWVQNQSPQSILLIPFEGKEMSWVSPIEVFQKQLSHELMDKDLRYLAGAVKAYRAYDESIFQSQMISFNQASLEHLPQDFSLRSLALERVYNKWNLFFYVKWLYLFVFFGVLFLLLWRALQTSRSKLRFICYKVLFAFAVMVFSGHVLGLVLRMLILQRAPVSTLYETFVFVALIAVGIALLLECLAYNILGLLVASVSGYLLLSIAGRYAMDGDTFRVLQAVLDSNFWLSTHVVTITMGYAICCVAGLLGHVYLFQSVYPKVSEGTLKQTARLIYGVLAAGLLFSFLGTILGGIWADQSWGRFWGWDPKENGALLIVLWCATLFHARMGGMIRDWGFAAGAIFGNISVMLAWFGINLLGVGLHSYGFTEGIAKNLYLFIAFEVVFVGVFAVLERRGRQVTMNKERVKQNEQQ